MGLPHCRASQLYIIWPPAWTGFHVSYRVFITGPPALSGFPYTHNKASGIDRLPCEPCERCFVATCRYSLLKFGQGGFDWRPLNRGPFWGPLYTPPQTMSPNCGGTSFEGPVSDPIMVPVLGSALGRVQEKVCAMVAAIEYPALCVADIDGCVCA